MQKNQFDGLCSIERKISLDAPFILNINFIFKCTFSYDYCSFDPLDIFIVLIKCKFNRLLLFYR